MTPIAFDNSYFRELPGAYTAWQPVPVRAPRLLFFNRELAEALGLDVQALAGPEGAAIFAGNVVPEGAEPLAQVYAGHQFGGFSARLGDGRALLLGEVIDQSGARRDIALKGSGRTPYSRGGDGRAAIGPMLREVLIGEAMHALGIPSTRALAVAATGEAVMRERTLQGAVLTRIAASHLRVGTLQYFAARGEIDLLRALTEYAIARHDPDLVGQPDRYLALLERVGRRQAALIAQWMNVGFIHGVMNTDNMTLSGESIDYGPCAFMEAYDPDAVFSSIDTQGRYAYSNQPLIARWNLARLAEALLPLIADGDEPAAIQQAIERATAVIDAFPAWYDAAWRSGQRAKLGLGEPGGRATGGVGDDTVNALADDWLSLLESQRVDFTQAWRSLSHEAAGAPAAAGATVESGRAAGAAASPEVPVLRDLFLDRASLDAWLTRWRAACAAQDATGAVDPARRAAAMLAVNPAVIPRNHRVEEALAAAGERDELGPFERLLDAVRHPYEIDRPGADEFVSPAPAELTADYRTFCGT